MSFTASLTELVNRNSNGLLGKHESWSRVSLGEIAFILNGFAFASTRFTKGEGVPLMRIRDISNNATDSFYVGDYDPVYLVNTGELVVGMDGDFNCAFWKGELALLNQRVCKITVKDGSYNLKFLSYVLPGYLSEINKETSSVTVKHLSSNTVAQIPLPLPPVAEQQRIVEKIEELFTKLDAGVNALKTARAQLGRYRQSVLKAAVTGELTREWREAHRGELEPTADLLARILQERRAKWEADQLAKMQAAGKPPKNDDWKQKYQEPTVLDTSELPELPQDWIWSALDAVCKVTSGFAFKSSDFINEGIPAIKIANIGYGKFVWKQQEYLPPDFVKCYVNFSVFPSSVLIALTRPITDNTVKACMYPTDAPVGLLNQRVAMLTPHQCYSNLFLLNLLQSELFKNEIKSNLSETLQPNLSPLDLQKIAVPIPPEFEQKAIVEEVERLLSIANATEQTIEQSLKQAERLRQSILQRAFSGKLVPQDPTDEPASSLLERIREERAREAEVKPKQKSKSNKPKPATQKRKSNKRTQAAQPSLIT